jgi:hypothetical protein
MDALSPERAQHFAQEWISAWNAHDLERILAHYDDDFEMRSPVIVQIGYRAEGRLKGKAEVAGYWAKALGLVPDLEFKLLGTFVGVDSLALLYEGVKGRRVVEVFHFGAQGRVVLACAHYA